MIKLDDWQQEVLETKGNICLRSGRQVGKSTIISIKAGQYALAHHKKIVMVIAKTERQAQLIFSKILDYIYNKNKAMICGGLKRPTKSKIQLENKTEIYCLPAGESGYGIRGYTIDLLIGDEAAFIPEKVWTSVTPMLAITRGEIWLLSTPHLKEGFYYRCFSDERFTNFHVSSEDCPRKDQVFLDYEKSWMTKAQYAREYLGEFAEELRQLFSDELIEKTCILKREIKKRERDYFLGVDIARMGKDESTFEIIDGTNRKALVHVDNIITRKTLLTETEDKIIQIGRNNNYDRKSIGIDDAGLGAGVFDSLMRNDELKRKIVGLSNAKRVYERDSSGKKIIEKEKKALKELMYIYLLRIMERGEIQLLDDDEIKLSLQSIQYEYNKTGEMIIWGSYSHICEGIIRACWCMKDKTLNIMSAIL